MQNVFKSNLNAISTGRYKSERKKVHWKLENIKLPYESREVVITLFTNYYSIVSGQIAKSGHKDDLSYYFNQHTSA